MMRVAFQIPRPLQGRPGRVRTRFARGRIARVRGSPIHTSRGAVGTGSGVGSSATSGADIVAADGVARFYEVDQFQPRWQDPARLDRLIAAIADLQYDRLDPPEYHVPAPAAFPSRPRGGKVRGKASGLRL